MADTIEVLILDDGSVRVTVAGKVSSVNHGNADKLLLEAQTLLGGPVTKNKLGHQHSHTNEHEHEHEHTKG
jgi:hypothetical protein